MPKRALLSVSDKSGLLDLGKRLQTLGFQLISTGGTQRFLQEKGIKVTGVEEVTDFPECFDGRVKTLHPKVFGGILFRRDMAEDQQQAAMLEIEAIDLVIVNLYPFAATMADPSKTEEEIIEQIDIGGPSLLRAAAKNHASVTVVCDAADYDRVLAELEGKGDTSPGLKRELAAKVFLHTAAYDALIAKYLSKGTYDGVMLTGGRELRYGENPHQWGKYYSLYDATKGSGSNTSGDQADSGQQSVISTNLPRNTGHWPLATDRSWGKLLQGKPLSYLNILDANGAWEAVHEFLNPTAVLVKHATPSGIASHADITEAFQRAYDADRLSAFGVIIALNRPCTEAIVRKIIDLKIFTEVVVAPAFEPGAVELLKQKPNIRVIEQVNGERLRGQTLYRSVMGGMLVQQSDSRILTAEELKPVTDKKPTAAQVRDLLFAWKAVKSAKSNAIVFAKDLATIGIGSGQTSRVDATWIAARRAGEKAKGAVMASDAFFPFPDSVEEAAKHGIAAIVQPGGSIRDEEVFKKANELGIAMVVTGVRGFRH
ncbi:MAG: bifunctional phosphoribosylaminoimidazolecarboxamide formyltransferase/inosine monophosphate cyclohydrolase [Candidatus Peribacteraceae bacterium]|nr:bifunctional phosphoribosylaminoimidazolecarboxamide formyltransferase/inosine monophosphate cyclohydrolase [Candidatus Peribacteraceae bacterium]